MVFERFKGLNIIEFAEKFSSNDNCLEYLSELKWANGFYCSVCGNTTYWQGSSGKPKNRVCKSCRHIESPTSNTVFHKIKFDLKKAFWIIFEYASTTKSMSSSMIAKRYNINEKTAWRFTHKIRCTMQSSGKNPLTGNCEADEFYLGGHEEKRTGRGAVKKKKALVIIEKSGEYGIKRAYIGKIKDTSSKELGSVLKKFVGKEAQIKTDKWKGYLPLKGEYNITQEVSSYKENFKLTHRFIQGFKSWIRGIYHHVSERYYQTYMDEYCYRFNRNNSKESIFANLMERLVLCKPILYKNYSFAYNI